MKNEKNILLEFICDNFHMTEEEGEQSILDGKYSLLSKSCLHDFIAESLTYKVTYVIGILDVVSL